MLNFKKYVFLLLVSISINSHAFTEKEKHCVAEMIYHEARGENIDGQIALINVIQNRIKSDKFPNNACDVIYQKGQFSWVGKSRTEVKNKKYFLGLLAMNKKVINDSDVLFFTTGKQPTKNSVPVKKIGRHTFYKIKRKK